MAIDAKHFAVPAPSPQARKDAPTFAPSKHPNFTLMHHPASWECLQVDGEWTWLPRLKRLKEMPGVNGVRGIGKNNVPDSSIARTQYADRGWHFVPHDCIPDDSELLNDGLTPIAGKSYVVSYQGARGKFHLLRWDIPKKVAGKWDVICDEQAYNRFRKMLVEEGLVPELEPEVKEAIVDRMRTRISRNAKNAHIPTVKKVVDEAQEKVEAMTVAPTKPKPKRKAKAAANG